MKSYVFALVSPLGRLSLPAYWLLAGPIAVVIFAIHWYLKGLDEYSSTWTAIILLLMAMQSCLLAGRLQDCDWNGIVVLPLIGLTTFALLVDLDPLMLGSDPETVAKQWGFVCGLSYLATALTAITCVYALLNFGDDTDNDYGPPFGETSESAQQKHKDRIRDRVRAEYATLIAPPPDRYMETKARITAGGKLASSPLDTDRNISAQWDADAAPGTALGFPPAPAQKTGFSRQ